MSTQQDLWSFIKTRKATQSASLKILQEFVLSLNKQELRHLIECYLKSKLSQNASEPLTYKAAANKLLNNNNNNNNNDINNNINKMDQEILIKLNKKYGNKYNKKIVSKIQQKPNKKRRNKNLLSIHPEVLSYSFQYLSFKQLAKIQTVCLYFTYLNKKYQGLSHFYIKMDKKFCLNAMRNVIHLKQLTHFKHIDIEYAYNSRDRWNKDQERRSNLFEHILKVIITQSIGNLNVLTIDIPYFRGYNLPKSFNVLLFIMNEFNYLPITKLIWKRDVFIPSPNANIESILEDIKSKINIKFPKLQQFAFNYQYRYHQYKHRCIITPMIKCYNLLSLDLSSRYFNVFKMNDNNLLQLIIENLKNLQNLSICSLIDGDGILPAMHRMNNNNANINVTVKQLNIHFICYLDVASNQRKTVIQNGLSALFSIFIGIEMFEFKGCSVSIDWQQLLSKLCQHKHVYSIQNGAVCPLQSIQFNSFYSYEICENIINSLTNLKDEIYFDLKHFGIKMLRANDSLSEFIENYFIPFIKTCNSLKHIIFQIYGSNNVECSYLEPMLKLLCNIPKSLKSMEVKMPYFPKNVGKNKQNASTKLVQKLSQLLSEKDDESNLERIVFDGIKICKKQKEFLEFFFGYNQKLLIKEQKYYLTFI